MTDEYIRRQEMIDAVDHLHIIPSIDGTGKPTSTEDFRVQFIGTVLKVKSADVAPVIHGKWFSDVFCSECGWVNEVEPGFIGDTKGFNFCPNCGAKMDR